MSYKNRQKVATFFRYGLMILLAIVFAFPIVFMLVSSLKPSFQILRFIFANGFSSSGRNLYSKLL